MKADDWVLLPFPAANRDPEVFEDADKVIIDREVNRHAAFGLGIHRCAGSHLARMELRVALEVWLDAFPTLLAGRSRRRALVGRPGARPPHAPHRDRLTRHGAHRAAHRPCGRRPRPRWRTTTGARSPPASSSTSTSSTPRPPLGLDAFSHIEVVFVFDQVDPDGVCRGARHPRGRADWPLVGILGQRAKDRPNRIGLTTCEVRAVGPGWIDVAGLDAVDGTPVLDVKPHMAGFAPRGEVREPAWAQELMAGYW